MISLKIESKSIYFPKKTPDYFILYTNVIKKIEKLKINKKTSTF